MNKRSYKQSKGHAINEAAVHVDGIFGEIGQTLNANDALAIGCTLGTMLHSKDQCLAIVGIDNRSSSEVLETEMCRGLAASGCYVMRAGVAPAPAVQFSAHCLNAASIMISGGGGHPDINGFRICADGVPIYGKRLQRLIALAANGGWHKARGGVLQGNILEMYIKKLTQNVRSKRPLKVAWDLCGGAACIALPELSDQISGEHLMMNDTLDSQFGFELPDSFTATRIASLAEVVSAEKCDLGILINADCTQIAVVDNHGKLWESHRLFALFSREQCKIHPESTIVAGLDCPVAIRQSLAPESKLELVSANLGSVIEKLQTASAHLAYGNNGHYVFGQGHDFMGFDDALLSAVHLLNLLSAMNENLNSLYHDFSNHITAPRRHFQHSDPSAVLQAMRKHLILKQETINDLDGIRLEKEQGFWWLHCLEHEGKELLVLDVAATSKANLGEITTEFEQYFRQISSEVTEPEEIVPDNPTEDTAATIGDSVQAKALKAISDSDRAEIDFASRHWRSIRRANATPVTEEEAEKPKRPWGRK